MILNQTKEITLSLIDTFKNAGNVALELRKKGLKKETKSDNTPVTNGDIEVNNILTKKIASLTPQIPIISEETSANKKNKNLDNFWLIDPIDGTSEYINNREEFTINAALIIKKKPVLGVIYAPDKKRLFYSYGPANSFEIINHQEVNLNNLSCKTLMVFSTRKCLPIFFISHLNMSDSDIYDHNYNLNNIMSPNLIPNI